MSRPARERVFCPSSALDLSLPLISRLTGNRPDAASDASDALSAEEAAAPQSPHWQLPTVPEPETWRKTTN